MAQEMTVEADPREEFGKNVARRLRQGGRVPAVVYGGGGPSIPVSVEPARIQEILHSESGQNAIFSLQVRGKAPARVMIKDWQEEPLHGGLLHVDMIRIARGAKLKVKVPIRITGESKGVKVQGGVFEFVLREVEVECLPDDIPEHLTADVTELTLGHSLRVSDLPVGPKFQILTDANSVVAHVVALKVEEEVKPAAEAAEAAPTEPEVIRKGKAEEAPPEAEASATKKEKEKEKEKEKS
jgi:large subunit ribosomal protein L25